MTATASEKSQGDSLLVQCLNLAHPDERDL